MNFSSILSEIEKLDPEVYERTSPRRKVIRNWSRKVALAAIPFALGSLFQKAYGKSTSDITDILNFALKLEYLESQFYKLATGSPILIPQLFLSGFQTISAHESAHVEFLKNAITGAGGTPIPNPADPGNPGFDYSGGKGSNVGPFSAVFADYATFLALAQVFEDTGVRAYKGQAVNLMGNHDILTAALNIHSIEARHAAHIRKLRKDASFENVKPWITQNASGINGTAAQNNMIQPSYNGEENTAQAGILITGLNSLSISADSATEAFDEPLDMVSVLAIVDPFFI